MRPENIELTEKIERCERLARSLTDEEMRHALEVLADDYKAQLKGRGEKPFMLNGDGGGSAAGAR